MTLWNRIRAWLSKPKQNVSRYISVVVDGRYVANAHGATIEMEETGLIVGPQWTDTRKIRHLNLEDVEWAETDVASYLTDACFHERVVSVQIVSNGIDRAFDARVAGVGNFNGVVCNCKLVGEEWTVSL